MASSGASHLADPDYVRRQYADDERLRIRIETHERYSERKTSFTDWILERADARAGQRLLDVGSGPGGYHGLLGGVRVVAVDLSAGMLSKVHVPAVQGDAQALPFRAASFDRAMANHVLYHVPDIPLALSEIRRVTREGGKVVLTTNSRETMRALWELTDPISDAVGVARYQTVALRFGLEDLALVGQAFPKVRVEVYEDAFLFPSPTPVLDYVASMWVDLGTPEQRAEFLRRLEVAVSAMILREGVFRVPKTSGCFVADV